MSKIDDFSNYLYKGFLEDIGLEEIKEDKKIKLDKHTKFVFTQIEKVLDYNEIEELQLSKILDIWNILSYKKQFETEFGFLKGIIFNEGFSLNIDLGNYCEHNCKHCMVSANTNIERTDIDKFLKQFDRFSNKQIKSYIKEISLYNFGEFLEYSNFDKLFDYFLSRGVNTFLLTSRGAVKGVSKDIYEKIYNLKNKYKNFDLILDLSFDNFSTVDYKKNLENLFLLHIINTKIFNKKTTSLKISVDRNNFIDVYNSSILNKLYVFIELIKENNDFEIVCGEDNVIEEVRFENDIKLKLNYFSIIPIGRGKKINTEKLKTDGVSTSNCYPTKYPYSINLYSNGDLKACFSKDIPASKVYNFSNINDKDFFEKILNIKREYYKNLTIEDLVGKGEKHFCMAVNLLKEKRL